MLKFNSSNIEKHIVSLKPRRMRRRSNDGMCHPFVEKLQKSQTNASLIRGDNLSGDLHCHTIKSDGSMEPCRVVDLAARLKIPCIAITDHDTMDGVGSALSRGADAGVKVIPGIEVSTYDYINKKKVHILCYFPQNPGPLLEKCRQTLKSRTEASLEMARKVGSRYPIDVETVKKYAERSAAVYKQHIMLALMESGYSLSVFGELYSSLFSSKNGWARIDLHFPEARDAIRLIKETGGAAVLAHPGVYGNFDIIEELCGMGLDGIEVWHPRQSQADTRRAFEAAERFSLIRTGGSDFHGMYASRVTELGARQAENDELEKLLERFG
jgi:phosphoribosyl 1,2-cyclic phosphate 1,2-diphosphodiesterase